MKYNYTNIIDLGCNQPCVGDNDPLTYCLVDSIDKNFQHAPIGSTYGPRSRQCQLYLAERCAKNWDGFCEYFYKTHNKNNDQWPDNLRWPNTAQAYTPKAEEYLTLGDQLLQNAGARRFCEYPECVPVCEPFDPMNPLSPKVSYFVNPKGVGTTCIPVCRVNTSMIQNDPVMQRMLENPTSNASTLINICNTSRREGTDLSGTDIGRFCDAYFAGESNQQNVKNLRQQSNPLNRW